MVVKVGVILPSRGLMFSKTAEEILKNVQGVPHKFFFAHKLPIPDCFEFPTMKALKDPDITHLWFVEDDMILPDDILKRMLNEYADVVTCDYPTTKDGRGAVFQDRAGGLVFAGLGCTLVKREVMDRMEQPYFRTDVRWTPTNHGTFIKLTATKTKAPKGSYGMQDVNFYMQLHRVGAEFSVYPERLGQRKLVKLGEAGTNDGAHQIEEWTELEPNWWLSYITKLNKEPESKLKTVTFPDGKRMNVSHDHANKLIKNGHAKPIKPRALIIDYGDLYEQETV